MNSKMIVGTVCALLSAGAWAGASAHAQSTSLTSILDNADFTLISSESSYFSFSPSNSDIIYCEKEGVMSI